MKLYRFRSNQETIVENLDKNLVKIVWASSWENGDGFQFIYSRQPENLIELSPEECQEILLKRESKGWANDHIGEISIDT